MTGRTASALLACPMALTLVGCGARAEAPDDIDWASVAVPTGVVSGTPAPPAESSVTQPSEAEPSTIAGDDADAVIAAYEEYVIESDRFFDLAIAEAARSGSYVGSDELDAILDGVAIGRAREFDVQTPQSLWDLGGVATTGAPVITTAEIDSLESKRAVVNSCLDISAVDYLDTDGSPLKPNDIPDFLSETVTLINEANPRNSDVVRWYVADRTSEQVDSCE